MKKVLLFAVALMGAMTATAQPEGWDDPEVKTVRHRSATNFISAEPVTAVAGSEVDVVFTGNWADGIEGAEFIGFQADYELPEGFSFIYEKYDVDEDEMVSNVTVLTASAGGQLKSTHEVNMSNQKFMCHSGKNASLKDTEGKLFSVPLAVDESVADGEYTLKITKQSYSFVGKASDCVLDITQDATGDNLRVSEVKIVVGDITGISAISTSAAAKVTYDLQGRRVNNAEKGVYIQNGKKVLVK